MNKRTLLSLHAFILLAGSVLVPGSVAGRSAFHGEQTIRLPLAGGEVEVQLLPDRGKALLLTRDGPNRWVFRGSTTALVGNSYSVALRNRTRERLKVVVGVDGVNVYHRDPIVGRADRDVGSILSGWSERLLRGWQLDQETAQRFVFSPPEWSEGQGRTDSQIGTIAVHVYRERQHYWREHSDFDHRPRSQEESPTERRLAPGAPIGTTTGDDVSSPVRTVRFESRTTYPEARAEIDYGRRRPLRWPRERGLLGLEVELVDGGSRIVAVEQGSEADRAGLEPWDVIVRLDTEEHPSPRTVRRILRNKHRGSYVFLRIRRGPHELAVKIRA